MSTNFEKYANEGNKFVKDLAEHLGHPEEISRTEMILRAVLHSLRDRLTTGESLNFISQLPMMIKALYVDNWKYHEKPLRLNTLDEFTELVKEKQSTYGETDFDWQKSTEEIVRIVLSDIGKYVSEGEAKDAAAQLPEELQNLIMDTIGK